jgi:hypothetical protein
MGGRAVVVYELDLAAVGRLSDGDIVDDRRRVAGRVELGARALRLRLADVAGSIRAVVPLLKHTSRTMRMEGSCDANAMSILMQRVC